MIGGLDYYEKIEKHDHHEPHEDNHVHGEHCAHDHEHEHGHDDTSALSPEELNHRKHKEYLEWLFNRLAGLETEVTQQYVLNSYFCGYGHVSKCQNVKFLFPRARVVDMSKIG